MDDTNPTDPEERFTQLYRRYQPQVLAYARRRVPEQNVGEAVADAFTAAWRHLDSAPPDPLPWLYRLASNAAINLWRRDSRWTRLQDRLRDRSRPSTIPDLAVTAVNVDIMTTALARLSDGDREVLLLTGWEGLTSAELAVALGCSEGTAKSRLHRARRRLTRVLDDADDADRSSATHHSMTTEVA